MTGKLIDMQKAQFEVIARSEYTKTDEKNPIDCSLYYIALRKKNVLVGLWRMAGWNREQAMTQRLLANNFQESRWKTAALKNAYALLGKRRFGMRPIFCQSGRLGLLTCSRVRCSFLLASWEPKGCCQRLLSPIERHPTCRCHRSRI